MVLIFLLGATGDKLWEESVRRMKGIVFTLRKNNEMIHLLIF